MTCSDLPAVNPIPNPEALMPTTTDPIEAHAHRRIVEFARTLAAELGVEDTYEDDEERVFALLVSAGEVYVDLQTESGSLGFRTAIDVTADGLVENLDIRFEQELNR
jgi:hypothetical protein